MSIIEDPFYVYFYRSRGTNKDDDANYLQSQCRDFTPQQYIISASTKGVVKIFDAHLFKLVSMIHVHSKRIHCLKISDSQRYAVTVGLDNHDPSMQTMVLKVWYITEEKSKERYCDIRFNYVESRVF